MPKRRNKGEGGLYQRCESVYGCPPAEEIQTEDGPRRIRPKHRCRGLWVGAVDLGWYDGKRQRRVITAKDYKVAKKKLDDLKQRVSEHGDVPQKGMTVEKWLRYWIDEIAYKRLKPSTRDGYRSKIQTMLIPQLGKHQLDTLQSHHLRTAYKRLGATRSSTTVLQAHAILRRALNDAMREQPPLVARNVATLLDAPRKAPSRREGLTTAEARAVLRRAALADGSGVLVDRIGSRWAAALLAGTRQGETLGLTLDCLHLDYVDPATGAPAPRLEVAWELQRIKYRHGCGDRTPDGAWSCGRKRAGSCPQCQLDVRADFEFRRLDGGLCLIRPKSRAGWRVVPIIPPLKAALRLRLELIEDEPNPHGLVWTRPDGRPIDPSDDTATWDGLLKLVGARDVTVHEARNTAASLLHEAGVDGHTVQQILGHSSVTTTRGYQHVDDRLMRDGLQRMVDLIAIEQ
jgi:integrase